MRNKFFGITFLIIVFVIGFANLSNGLHAVKPLVNKYIFQKEEANTGESITAAIDNVENTYNENFKYKEEFINVHGLLRKAIGNREVNGVIKLDNGMLIQADDKADVGRYSDSIVKLNEYLKSNGIEFMYIAAPSKVNEYDKQLPEGTHDYGNENQNGLLSRLTNEGVAIFDLREELHKETDDWYSAFFSTDHHWKPETGFWAYIVIAKELNKRFGYRLDKRSMDIDNYEIKVYEDWFLGQQGRRTGQCYGGIDDISIIVPKFDTEMFLTVPVKNIYRCGRYQDVIFDEVYLEKNQHSYHTYIGGNYSLVTQRNDNAINKKKCLILKDSYALTLQPYFSFIFSKVDVIDLRYFKDEMHETLLEYINRTKPDITIMIYSPAMIYGNNAGDEQHKAFEFGL